MSRKLKIVVDKQRCVLHHACINSAPGVFGADAEGRSEVLDVNGAPEEQILDAAFNCPVAAVGVFDAENGADLLD